MFSFRSDKTGFFVTIILLALLVAAVALSVVFLALQADWWVQKVIWSAFWVLCIVTVLVRVSVFRWQRRRDERARQQQQQPSADGAAAENRQGAAPKDE
jgi:membrane protein implicated in regulation of membrane protease activity